MGRFMILLQLVQLLCQLPKGEESRVDGQVVMENFGKWRCLWCEAVPCSRGQQHAHCILNPTEALVFKMDTNLVPFCWEN